MSGALTGDQALMAWVTEAVEHIDWPSRGKDFQGYAAASLLVLEVYGCAKGAVSAEEVADWIRPDPLLRAIFPESVPSAAQLIAFRKCHRLAIQQCLSRVLDVALKTRFGDDAEHLTPIDYCVVRGLDAWFKPRCGPDAEREAIERIGIQDWTDNMSRD
ncbi:MAG: hypothetical protein JXQ71_12205 [Verrucomicrobia bacterium]|nr:hypothetical protein [Verrucomicrobiota bacterium]